MQKGANGDPDPSTVKPFLAPAAAPVDLQFGPGGELWYVDLGGAVRRIGFTGANHPPVAAVSADKTSGDPPLTVNLDARGSSDADPGDALAYAWDVDNDDAFDDGNQPTLTTTFATEGLKVVRVRVTDQAGDYDVAVVVVVVGQSNVPGAVITDPADRTTVKVGDPIDFSGAAATGGGLLLPASTMKWSADVLHCPDACHHHIGIFSADGVLSGTMTMPDHELPASVELHLSVTWDGITTTTTRVVDYAATDLTLRSEPAGVQLAAGTHVAAGPYTQAFATNGTITLSAPTTATINGAPYVFSGWSDQGARAHSITVPDDATTYTATYAPAP
jgi:PKD repeat protein